MLAISLLTVLDELLADDSGTKNFAGNVKDVDQLLDPANLNRLTKLTPVIAFLAFHPVTDQPIADYVRTGVLSADSGPNILVLFALDQPASAPVPIEADSFASWLELDTSSHPSYEIIRLLFDTGVVPPLPGIVFFRAVGDKTDALYVELTGLKSVNEVQSRLRDVFALADEVGRKSTPKQFGDQLGIKLSSRKIPYRRTQHVSVREWLIRAFQIANDHLGDIVSVAGLII
jgi:hypothetical protein